MQRTVDGHGDAAALAHHVRALRQLGQVTLPSCEVLGAHGGADRAAEVVQDDRHACKAAAPKLVSRVQLRGQQVVLKHDGGCEAAVASIASSRAAKQQADGCVPGKRRARSVTRGRLW